MTRLGTYAYLNASLRAKLGKLLSSEQYERIVAAANIEAIYEELRHTEYAHAVADARTADDLRHVETALVDHLIAVHREVAAHTRGSLRSFLTELLRKYEVENLKVLLRVWSAKAEQEKEFIYRETICHDIPVDSILGATTIEEVIVLLEDTPYRRPIWQARESFKKTRSLFYLEVALDQELYEATWRAIQQLPAADRRIAARLVGIEIDVLNITWISRFIKYYKLALPEITGLIIPHGLEIKKGLLTDVYPGIDKDSFLKSLFTGLYSGVPQMIASSEETQQLHLLEALLKELFVQQVKKALGGFPFTVGVAIAYLRLKKMEVANLITILNAKTLNVPSSEMENNLIRV